MGTTVIPPIGAVLVVIPARNEEVLVERCVRSVIRAAREARRACDVETWIVVAADFCTDGTVQVASACLADEGEVIVGEWREVGSARAAGVAKGLDHLPIGVTAWIANTDADCEVPADWMTQQLSHARRGADAVFGIVTVDSFDEHEPVVAEHFASRYLLAADGTHEHVHGANFGVRADRYLAVGGWPPMSVSEDHGLARRLMSVDASIVRTIDLTVCTSGRRVGRARGGFADMLIDLGASA